MYASDAHTDLATMVYADLLLGELRGKLRFVKSKRQWVLFESGDSSKIISADTVKRIIIKIIDANGWSRIPDMDVLLDLLAAKKDIRITRPRASESFSTAKPVRCINCQHLSRDPYLCLVDGEGSRYSFSARHIMALRKCRHFRAVRLKIVH